MQQSREGEASLPRPRFDGQGLAERRFSIPKPAQVSKQVGVVNVELGAGRLQLQAALQARQCLVRVALRATRESEQVQGVAIVGVRAKYARTLALDGRIVATLERVRGARDSRLNIHPIILRYLKKKRPLPEGSGPFLTAG